MLTNESIMAWLKTLSVKADNYYCGYLDAKKEKSFGVYNAKGGSPNDIAVGGKDATQSLQHDVSLLVHWNGSTRETQNTAIALYEAISDVLYTKIGEKSVDYIRMANNGPVDVGRDESGVFEYVIDFTIFYERGE